MKHYLIALILLSSCSANYHLNQAKRHLKIAEQKGADIKNDTTFIKMLLKFKSDAKQAEFEKPLTPDTSKANTLLAQRDTLLIYVSDCSKATPEQKKEAKKELAKNTKKIQDAIYKDGTYTFKPDSIVTITLTLDNGKIKVSYKKKEEVFKKEVDVPVAIDQVIKAGLTTWETVILGIVIALFALGVGYFIGMNRKR